MNNNFNFFPFQRCECALRAARCGRTLRHPRGLRVRHLGHGGGAVRGGRPVRGHGSALGGEAVQVRAQRQRDHRLQAAPELTETDWRCAHGTATK